MTTLAWRNVTPTTDPKFLVKWTELNTAIVPGTLSRFQLCEVRTYDPTGQPDRVYMVRDAHRVTDEQVKAGKRPPIVNSFFDLDEAIKWCQGQK